jgi:hypothetical protein
VTDIPTATGAPGFGTAARFLVLEEFLGGVIAERILSTPRIADFGDNVNQECAPEQSDSESELAGETLSPVGRGTSAGGAERAMLRRMVRFARNNAGISNSEGRGRQRPRSRIRADGAKSANSCQAGGGPARNWPSAAGRSVIARIQLTPARPRASSGVR